MGKKSFWVAVGAIFLLTVFTNAPAMALKAKPITLHFCSGTAGVAINDVAEHFGAEVEKRTNGRVKFEYLWGGAIAKPREELEAVKTGLSEMGVQLVQYHPSKLALNNFGVACPLGSNDPRLLTKVVLKLYDEVPELSREFEVQNQVIITPLFGGGYDAQSKVPIKHLEDFKGKKIAMSGTYWPHLFKAAGATLVAIPFADRYMALQTGMIDATMSPATHVRSWYDIFSDYTITRSGSFACFLFTINMNTWKKLPPEIRKVMKEVGRETAFWYANVALKLESEALEYLKGKGIKVHRFTDEDLAKWGKITPEIPLMWIRDVEAKGKPGAKVMKRYISLIEEHGYSWPKKWKTSR